MRENHIIAALKGMIVGGTMLVPGVSGGSMAMILGIYHSLISAVSSFMKHKRKSFFFLISFSLGAGLGMFLLANPLLSLIEQYPMPTLYFFLGAVAGGIPLIYKQSQVRSFSFKIPLYIALGFVIVLLFSAIPSAATETQLEAGALSFMFLLPAGIIAAVALVLPGISVSYLLLLMGLYDETMKAVSELYLPFLIPLGLGLIGGILLTTRLLEQAMTKHPQGTYLIILGFVLGSMLQVFPGIPTGTDIALCILMLILGFAAIQLISIKEMKGPSI